MSNLAHIAYPSGGIVIPVDGPHGDELICELVDRYGTVRWAFDGVVAEVQLATHGHCRRCRQRLRRVVCTLAAHRLCLRCCKAVADSAAMPPHSAHEFRALLPAP